MFLEVVADPEAGAADVLGAGVPFATIEQGPALVAGGVVSSAAHPAKTKITAASGARIRITRR
jgi:hypothetical protein